MGAKPLAGFAGETITEGLDGLRERLAGEYYRLGRQIRQMARSDRYRIRRFEAVMRSTPMPRPWRATRGSCAGKGIVPIVRA
jgi:fructose-bisphosphate aldolase class I